MTQNTQDQQPRTKEAATMGDTDERSVASAGSVAGEPVAWGVLRVGGSWVSILANEVQAETSRKSFDKMENWVHEAIPLYRSPTLTDAEREALEWFAKFGGEHDSESASATVRGLLERLKRPQNARDHQRRGGGDE